MGGGHVINHQGPRVKRGMVSTRVYKYNMYTCINIVEQTPWMDYIDKKHI